MISVSVLRTGATAMVGTDVQLMPHGGRGRVAEVDDVGVDLLVTGVRVRLTWGRLDDSLRRFVANHTLTVDELGGGQDAIGIVSLLASVFRDDVAIDAQEGLIVLRHPEQSPIHQYADMDGVAGRRRPRRR